LRLRSRDLDGLFFLKIFESLPDFIIRQLVALFLALLELAHTAAQRTGQIGQFFSAKQHPNNRQADQHVRRRDIFNETKWKCHTFVFPKKCSQHGLPTATQDEVRSHPGFQHNRPPRS